MKNVKIIVLILLILFFGYNLKTNLGINLDIIKGHFPSLLEKESKGFIHCRWFANSHHCN